MQTTHKIAGTSATGYATYLTSESDRGDYYVAAGEEDEVDEDGGVAGGAQGRWHGSQELLMKLGLSPNLPVQKDELSAYHTVTIGIGRRLLKACGRSHSHRGRQRAAAMMSAIICL